MNKEDVLRKIAEKEYQFFLKIDAENPECKRENTFKIMRISRFYPFSEDTLLSYLKDLEDFSQAGRNPIWEKYAIMEGKLVTPEDNEKQSIIKEIIKIEIRWQEEMHQKYSHVVELNENFSKYLKAELTTFSLETLKKYYNDLLIAVKNGRNFAYESYFYTFSQLGYSSLDDVEKKMKKIQMNL